MKNLGNFFACLKQVDLNNGQIILYDTDTQFASCFPSAGELFDAGWVADLTQASQHPLLLNTEVQHETTIRGS